MAGRLDLDRSQGRRDRTLAGSQCVICEEPLEHTLRGERVFQLSCTHVAHEACFYEYVREPDSEHCPRCEAPLELDASRGGNMINLEKLVQTLPPIHQNDHYRNGQTSPYATFPMRDFLEPTTGAHASRAASYNRGSTDNLDPQPRSRLKKKSNGTMRGKLSAEGLGTVQPREDLDNVTIQSLEPSTVQRSLSAVKSPIPPPNIVIRSEYPTMTHSRQPQSLTCLVTVEVPQGKWTPHVDDFHNILPKSISGSVRDGSSIRSPEVPENESYQSPEELKYALENLHARLDNWHGLDFTRFGKLRLHGKCYVGKDRQSWQELWCYLFDELLVCVKEKKILEPVRWAEGNEPPGQTKLSLKGSIQITRHLNSIELLPEHSVLTLSLTVPELPFFNLYFGDPQQFGLWQRALSSINESQHSSNMSETDDSLLDSDDDSDDDLLDDDDDDEYGESVKDNTADANAYGAGRSNFLSAKGNSYSAEPDLAQGPLHVPVDVVVVLPISSSMHGLKIQLLRDTVRFVVQQLGPQDRLGLVTFGAAEGAQPLIGMTMKAWEGWHQLVDSIRAVSHRAVKGDLIEGANVAMDLLMQRKTTNPLSSILIISDSASTEADSVDFVVSRAEAAKVSVFCFGLGLTHKPDIMIELATRTKASYLYVKDWMMLRECVAGCLGSIQSTSHQGAKLKLKLPEGSGAKFIKITGALQVTKRSTGRDAEVSLGDLRFGDKRDILVQLAIDSGNYGETPTPADPWESIVSGLEALGGPLDPAEDATRVASIEEVPILQADLIYGDLLRQGATTQLAHPTLLAITMLSPGHNPDDFDDSRSNLHSQSNSNSGTLPIPPHPGVVQRRMELLTSDMLMRALALVNRGLHERALHLLRETRSILKGLGKGTLPPLPASASMSISPPTSGTAAGTEASSSSSSSSSSTSSTTRTPTSATAALTTSTSTPAPPSTDPSALSNQPPATTTSATSSIPLPPTPSPGTLSASTVSALDSELESAVEWIAHPAVFARDARKAVLQAVGAIASQRAYTFRTELEALWAARVAGVAQACEASRAWRGVGGEMAEEG